MRLTPEHILHLLNTPAELMAGADADAADLSH